MDVNFVSIIGYQNVASGGSKHTIYMLEVIYNGTSYAVSHRYQDFKELYDRLSQEGVQCPTLPPKKFLGSFNPDFLAKRQQELNTWLNSVCNNTDKRATSLDAKHSESLHNFLHENKTILDCSVRAGLCGAASPKPDGIFHFASTETVDSNGSGEHHAVSTGDGSPSCNDATPEKEESSNLYGTPRTSLDDFELLKVIGKGSYGKVTLVKKKEGGKLFAMKSLSKPNVKRRNQVEHTNTERRVLGRSKHPFIVHMHYAFQTRNKLYFVLDYCPGGELFFHLSRMEKFPEHMARFYAAEISLALGHLHDLGVVYRDLKPENILFDDKGHVMLADFGLAKEGITSGDVGTNSMCGTPEYLPPEILDRVGHGTAVDWWALGMVLYEMLTGLPPWYTRNRQKLFDRVRNAPLTFPSHVSEVAQSFIRALLIRSPTDRLGSKSTEDVKSHPFFASINWEDLGQKRIQPPFNPCQNGDEGEKTKNFEAEFTKMNINSLSDTSNMSARSVGGRGSLTFQNFTYNTPSENFINTEEK